MVACQQGNRLQVSSNVGPLRWTMRLFPCEEQRNRRSEELIVASILFVAARLVFTRDADRLIEQFTDLEAPRLVRLAKRLGINRVVGALAFRQLCRHPWRHQR